MLAISPLTNERFAEFVLSQVSLVSRQAGIHTAARLTTSMVTATVPKVGMSVAVMPNTTWESTREAAGDLTAYRCGRLVLTTPDRYPS